MFNRAVSICWDAHHLSIYLVEQIKVQRQKLEKLAEFSLSVAGWMCCVRVRRCTVSLLYISSQYITRHICMHQCSGCAVGVACISRCLPWQVSAIFCLGPRINKCQRWAGLGSDLMHSWTAELTSDPDTTLQLILRQHSHGTERKLDFDGHPVVTSLGRH